MTLFIWITLILSFLLYWFNNLPVSMGNLGFVVVLEKAIISEHFITKNHKNYPYT